MLRLSFPGFFNKPWTEIVTMTALRSLLFLTVSAVAAMNARITASTKCPASIFANRRMANTPCLMKMPRTSITKIIGTIKILSANGISK